MYFYKDSYGSLVIFGELSIAHAEDMLRAEWDIIRVIDTVLVNI